MATIYVIHDPSDRDFVESTLLKPLPSLGFDRWISSAVPASAAGGGDRAAIASCAATMVVVSNASRDSDAVHREAALGLHATQPMIPIQVDQTEPEAVTPGLGALPKIDPGDAITRAAVPLSTRLRAGLPELLPPVDTTAEAAGAEVGRPIDWNEESFSEY